MPFSVKDLLELVGRNFETSFVAKSLIFRIKCDSDLPPILGGDSNRLRQVLSNFVSNAVKFSIESGSVEIYAQFLGWSKKRRDSGSVCEAKFARMKISVTDTGVGISMEDQRKLFQAFSQIRAGDLQQGRGSGLGLCIAKNIVHLMGGTIGVHSQSGRAYMFRVKFTRKTHTHTLAVLLN